MTTAYLGLDLHANSCPLGVMDGNGTFQGHQHFRTSEAELIPRVSAIDAEEKRLALEASTLSRWAARTLDPYVEKVLVCDPRENQLLSRNPHKSDEADAYTLCRLLRLGNLPVTRDPVPGPTLPRQSYSRTDDVAWRTAYYHRRPAKINDAGEWGTCVVDFFFHTVKAEVQRAEKRQPER